MKNTTAKPKTDQEVIITKIFDAPRNLVYKAWTDPNHLKNWFAPSGCTISFRELDIREGGTFHSCVNSPGYGDCWCKGVYKQLVQNEKIVYTMAIADEAGNLIDAVQAGMDPEWPMETTVTVIFSDQDGKTKLTLYQTVAEDLAKRTGAYPSWVDMLNRLEQTL